MEGIFADVSINRLFRTNERAIAYVGKSLIASSIIYPNT